MRVNQSGEEVREEHIQFAEWLKPGEAETVLFALLDHLGLDVVRTNATKHGGAELQVRPRQ